MNVTRVCCSRLRFGTLRSGLGLIFGLILFVTTSCASYTDEVREMRLAFQNHDYTAAMEKLTKAGISPEGRNRLLYHLERAMILDRLGKLDEAKKMFLQADKIIDDLYTTSISKTAATYLYNESASDYEGEDYEKVAVHTMLALEFLDQNELKEATVEARKINSRLNEINQRLGDAPNKYAVDAFALYLTGLIFEARGMLDDAIIDYRKALKTYESDYPRLFQVGVPEGLPEALARLYAKRHRNDELRLLREQYQINASVKNEGNEEPVGKPTGEVVVIHEVGFISIKVTNEFVFPLGGQIVRFSFPVIKQKSYVSFGRTGVEIDHFINADLVQDNNAIAAQTLEDRRLRLIMKQGARLLAKGQMVYQAEKRGGPLAGLVANIYTAVTETADTRSWTLLPSGFKITRLRLPVGEHDIKIYTDGRLSQIKRVKVEPGAIAFIRDY